MRVVVALAGEDIVIAKGSNSVVRLVAITPGKFKIGLLKDQLTNEGPDFSEPLDEAEMELWESGLTRRYSEPLPLEEEVGNAKR